MHALGSRSPLLYVTLPRPPLIQYHSHADIQAQPNDSTQPLPWAQHADEYDTKEDDPTASAPPGILIHTDYSTGSDEAWAVFCSAIHYTEHDFFADQAAISDRDDT